MPLRDRYSHAKDGLKRRLGIGSKNASTTSLLNESQTAQNDTLLPDEPSLPEGSTPTIPTSFSMSITTGKRGGKAFQRAQAAAWSGLHKLLGVLESTSDVFPPLSSASAAEGRRDYEDLRIKLDSLLGALSEFLAHSTGLRMTTSMKNLCIDLEREVKEVEARYSGKNHKDVPGDSEEILASYRRIQGYVERLTLNANLSMWKTVSNLEAEARLRDLSPTRSAVYNSAESEDAHRRACTPGTREKELAQLLKWARSKSSDTRDVYWVNGMAGTGKTTIAYSICVELEKSSELGASFFCSRMIPECRSVKLIIPSIAYQLARFSLPFRFALLAILEADPDAHTRVLDAQFETLLVKPLTQVKNALPTDFVIVIDALDECENDDSIGLILDVLLSRTICSDLPARFLLSSRPESKIYRRMMARVGNSLEARLVLHDLDTEAVNQDIHTFLRAELATVGLTPSQLASLASLSGVLFIFASTAARYIMEGMEDMEHEERLNMILGLSSASTSNKDKAVDQLYTSILQSVFQNENIGESVRTRLKIIVDTVVCAQEPVTVDTLAGLLQEKSGKHVEALLRRLSSVLKIADTNKLVATLHASFPEYMLDYRRSSTLHCDSTVTHTRVSHACFCSIKSVDPQFNICGLESSYLRDDQVPGLTERSEKVISPQLFYACRYWMIHLELGDGSDTLFGDFWDFLTMRLLLWMEVLNVKRCIDIGPGIIHHAEDWGRAKNHPKQILELIHDAWRFVSMFAAHAVSQSTPHLYVSMLPFWPPSAPITKYYAAFLGGNLQVRGTAIARRRLALLSTWTFSAPVGSACFSSDRSLIALSASSSVYTIDGITGRIILGPMAHGGNVRSIALSPNSKLLASASEDKQVRIWSTEDGKLVVRPLAEHNSYVMSVCFFPDGTRIASGSSDRTIRVWDVSTGSTVLGPIKAHNSAVLSVQISPDSSFIVSSSADRTIRIWDSQSGVMVSRQLEDHKGLVRSVSFSPDGVHIASGSEDTTVRLWNTLDNFTPTLVLQGHTREVNSVAFSPDSNYVVSGSSDFTVRLWDVSAGTECIMVLQGHVDSVTSVAFSPGGARIVSGSGDGTIRVWDAQSLGPLEAPTSAPGSVICVAISHDGSRIVSGSNDNTIRIWDSRSGQLAIGPLVGHAHWVNSVCFSRDGTQVISGSDDRNIRRWDAQTGNPIGEPLTINSDGVLSICLSPDGGLLAAGSKDGNIMLWDAKTQTPIFTPLRGHTAWVRSVCFAPDGLRLISGSDDATLRVWDVQYQQPLLPPLRGHAEGVLGVCISPDGARVASGSWDMTIRIWNARSGQSTLGPLIGHTDAVGSVCFSPNSPHIVSASGDRTLRIWDTQTGQMIRTLTGHTELVRSCGFSSNGSWVISGSDDQTIRAWDIKRILKSSRLQDARKLVDASEPHSSTALDPWSFHQDGWLIDPLDRIVAWVPPDLRHVLMHPCNPILISTDGSLQLDFGSAKLGTSWIECYKR